MRKVLLPVDGSDSAFQAALYLVEFVRQHGPVEVHVVNVQPKPVEWQTRGMEKDAINDHLAVAADLAIKPILHVLNEEKIPYQTQVKLGDPAEILAALAEELIVHYEHRIAAHQRHIIEAGVDPEEITAWGWRH